MDGRWRAHTIGEEEAGRTVEEILTGPLELSRRGIQRLTRSRGIRLNGRPAFLGRRVRIGDSVAVRIEVQEEPTLPPVEMPLRIVYEDRDLLVVDKDPGLLVHPTSPQHTHTLAHGLAHHFREQGIEARVRPVHRLDRDTSGALLIAKSSFSHQHLDRQIRAGTLVREYRAFVEGEVAREEGTIDAPIGRIPGAPDRRTISAGGQPARTHFRVEGRYPGMTQLRVRLETGRTHQIRVHFAHLGHPLVGDRLYGASGSIRLGRPGLHSARIGFTSPSRGEWIELEVPLPPDLLALPRRAL